MCGSVWRIGRLYVLVASGFAAVPHGFTMMSMARSAGVMTVTVRHRTVRLVSTTCRRYRPKQIGRPTATQRRPGEHYSSEITDEGQAKHGQTVRRCLRAETDCRLRHFSILSTKRAVFPDEILENRILSVIRGGSLGPAALHVNTRLWAGCHRFTDVHSLSGLGISANPRAWPAARMRQLDSLNRT